MPSIHNECMAKGVDVQQVVDSECIRFSSLCQLKRIQDILPYIPLETYHLKIQQGHYSKISITKWENDK